MQKRIKTAVEKAKEAFWAEIVGNFPEITSGDFPPDADFAFGDACMTAATVWVTGNLPPMILSGDLSRCVNCEKINSEANLVEARHLSMRVSAGEVMPSGECPGCSVLCHPINK